jgi:putative aldouronate transport system permease protein
MLSPSQGIVNRLVTFLGYRPVYFMTEPAWFRPLYVILSVWHGFGYSSVVYLASIVAIDQNLYEAAEIDGANRWQKMFRITLPCMIGSIVVMLIISVGNIFSVDLDRILLMYNPNVYETADVIQTYVYRIGFANLGFPDYSYGTAVNTIKSIIAFVLVVGTNNLASHFSDTRLF